MRSIFRYTILAVLAGLFLMPSSGFAQEKTAPAQAEKEGKDKKNNKTPEGLAPITLDDLAIDFPDVEGWEKGEIQKYPTEDLGFSINYESRAGGRVTIYVYNGGKKQIPDDVSDKVIKSEFNNVKREIRGVADAGIYENLKEIKNETVTLGGATGKVKVLYALYNFDARGNSLTSEIYIFGRQNKFVKIRATRSQEKGESQNKMVSDLLAAIDAFYSK